MNVNSKKFNKQIDGIQKQTTKAFGAMSIVVGNIMANMAQRAVSSIGSFVKDSIKKGSDLAELENVVESVFTSMADKVDTFAKNALDTYGLTEKQAKKMVGTFGAMSKSFGYSEQQAYNMATALTALAGDVASFYNLDVDEAYTKMKSVYTGETESLKELGVVMTQAALDEFALAQGFGKTTRQMSEQEKVALRLAFVQDKLKTATGDVIRTQDSWANQTRKLSGQIDSFKTAIGQGLINILTPVIKVINTIMAKLVQLANAFNSFTSMLMGEKSGGGGAGAAMAEVADAADQACQSTEGIASATDGAAKAAKKAQKSLMGFDEINKLTKPDDSSSEGGGGGAFNFESLDLTTPLEEQNNKVSAILDGIKGKINELKETFKEGFNSGLGDDFEASIGRIKSHITSIGTSLKGIFTDPQVVTSANECMSKIAYAMGQFSGSVVSVGVTIAENLIGGIDKFLAQNSEFLKNRIAGIFDATGNISEIAGNLCETFASVFEVFRGDTAKQITADLIGIVSNAALGMAEIALKIGGDILNCISQPIIDNEDKIKLALENTLKPVSTILSTLNTSVKETFDKLFEVYDTKIKPAFEGISKGLSGIFSTILDTYNTYLAPVLQELATKVSETWEAKVQPVIGKALEFIGKLADFISTLWQTVLAPFISWLVSTLGPVLSPIINAVGSLFINVFGAIATVIGGVFDILGGLLDFITGLFKGDWEQCWEGCKSIFEGFCNIISGLVSTVWNFIVGILTTAVTIIGGLFTTIWKIITGIITTICGAIKSGVKTAFDFVQNVFLTNGNKIKELASIAWNAVKGTITTVVTSIKTFVSTAFTSIKNVTTTIWNSIKTIISTVINTMKTVISTGLKTIKSVFVSVLTSIKSTVTTIFNSIWGVIKGVINSILGGIEGMVNGVISGFNAMIGAMNKLKFDVPDWVPEIGGQTFGFSIPSLSKVNLPRLAEGGYVRANQPQPVIVGDNKTQGEIIAPEGKILAVVLQALEQFFSKLKDSGYSSNNNGEVGDIIIPIYLDGSALDEVIVTAQQRRNIRSGGH